MYKPPQASQRRTFGQGPRSGQAPYRLRPEVLPAHHRPHLNLSCVPHPSSAFRHSDVINVAGGVAYIGELPERTPVFESIAELNDGSLDAPEIRSVRLPSAPVNVGAMIDTLNQHQ
jgi:hypothetical protein